MKTRCLNLSSLSIRVALALGCWLFVGDSASAQPFAAARHIIAGGGGKSTNGTFAVRGTIGQTPTGRMTNANQAISSGFWTSSSTTNNSNTNVVPSITIQPQGQTVNAGSNVTFTVVAAGTAPLAYRWRFNGTNISGGTTSSYTRTNAQAAHAGQYSVVVSNIAGSVPSSNAVLAVNDAPPTITAQPQSQNVAAGSDATFTVLAIGTRPLSYQWWFNATNIAVGVATNASYARTNAQSAAAGSYSVVVTNLLGSATSSVALLTVASGPPAIIAQSQNRTNTAGDKVTFFVVATGSDPRSYQWRYNGTNIASATNSTYRISPVDQFNTGTYSVVVTNASGRVTSSNADLTILGGIATTLARWDFNSPSPDTNFTTGVITPTAGSGELTVIGQGITPEFLEGASSDPASLASDNSALRPRHFQTSHPNKTAGVQCGVSTVGRSNILVTWQQRTSAGGSKYWRLQYTTNGYTYTDSDVITMSTNSAFKLKQVNLSAVNAVNNNPNFAFRIVAEHEDSAIGSGSTNYVGINSRGSVRFDLITVFVSATNAPSDAPTIVAQPQSQSVVVGSNATFTVVAAGSGPLSYQWLFNGANLAGSTASTLMLANAQLTDTGPYSVMVSNGFGSVSSAGAALIVGEPPSITTPPASQTVGAGTSVRFAVAAAGAEPLAYQWRFNTTNIAGATATNYTRSNAQPTNGGSYTVVVTNIVGSITSAVAMLTVTAAPPFIIVQSQNRTNSAGDKVSFFVVARGTEPLSYQWKFNGTNIASVNNSTYTLNPVDPTNAGAYSVVVTNTRGTATSSNANLTVMGRIADTRARWQFNSTTPDTNLTTGVTIPAIGGGTLAVIGAIVTTEFKRGDSSDPDLFLMDNSGLQTSQYSLDDPNKTAGVQCSQSTLGCSNILVTWKQRTSPTASKYWRFQYTTDGSNYTDADVITMSEPSLFRFKQVDLSAVASVNNNPNFGFRVVTEHVDTATGGGSTNYVGTARGFGPRGTARFDLITVFAAIGAPADADGNGLPDAWEMQYFGHTGVNPNGDADGDGVSNLREFLAGTNPTNAASVFRIVRAARTNNSMLVSWTTVGGHSYVLQIVTNSSGSLTTNFLDVSPVIAVSGTNEGTTNYLHGGGATNSAGYYRVRLVH